MSSSTSAAPEAVPSSAAVLPTIYVGLDVHKESVTLAVLPAGAPAPTRVDKLANDPAKLRRYFDRLAAQGTLRLCYEASGAGYVLYRMLRDWGYQCDVIAPSLIPKKPGHQYPSTTAGCPAAQGDRLSTTPRSSPTTTAPAT